MNKALSPKEAITRAKNEVPELVVQAWNNLIVENLKVQGGKASSEFLLEELANQITLIMSISYEQAKQKGWFDLEDIFRDKGWKVEFDRPGYNESYSPKFTFKSK